MKHVLSRTGGYAKAGSLAWSRWTSPASEACVGSVRTILVAASLALIAGCGADEREVRPDWGFADDPVAVVVGNGKYHAVDDLPTSVTDAEVVAEVLEDAGFDVMRLVDGSASELHHAGAWFEERVAEGRAAVFYYSGHALRHEGINYLLPVDAAVRDEADIRRDAVPLSAVLPATPNERVQRVLVLLDTGHGDPIPSGAWRGTGRSPQWTLAADTVPGGGILAYATSPGEQTEPSGEYHSLFTETLVQALGSEPTIEATLAAVRESVVRRTAGRQVPWHAGETDVGWDPTRWASQFPMPGLHERPAEVATASEAMLPEMLDTAAANGQTVRIGDAEYEVVAVPGAKGSFQLRVRHWTNGIVPYVLDSSLSGDQRDLFLEAAQRWASVAPVQFVPRRSEEQWVVVRSHPTMNRATVGMGWPGRPTNIEFSPDVGLGVVLHELGHTLGMGHEQSRSDRDRYVVVVEDNVTEGFEHAFERLEATETCTPYDYSSIMHYGTRFFSRDGDPTLLPTAQYLYLVRTMGRQRDLSATDIQDVRIAYGSDECPRAAQSDPAGAFSVEDERVDTGELVPGEIASGRLSRSDPRWGLGNYYDVYQYQGRAGERLTVRMDPEDDGDVDPYLLVFRGRAGDDLIAQNDDAGRRTRSAEVIVSLEEDMYTIVATSFARNDLGRYRLSLDSNRRVDRDVVRRTGFPEMVVLPAGRVTAGLPRREVAIESFAIGAYEVTVEEWDECVRGGGCPDEGVGEGTQPVTQVTWGEAQLYTRWLSELTGDRYRLPSEAEWEYAARAWTETRYYWGDSESCWHANGDWLSCDDGQEGAAPVGSFFPNAFGLHDVLGNAWEWTQDCWETIGRSHRHVGVDDGRRRAGDCSRAVRGGAWHNDDVRVTSRAVGPPNERFDAVGFRVARSIR